MPRLEVKNLSRSFGKLTVVEKISFLQRKFRFSFYIDLSDQRISIITNLLIATFGIYRSRIRETVDNPESSFTPLPQTITPVGLELDPSTPETLDNTKVAEEKPAN